MAEFNWTADDIKRAQRDFSNNFMRLDCIRTESYDIAIDCMTECIESKAVDIQPMKRGRWIITDDVEHFIAVCSECGRTEDSRAIKDMPYCHCGARMDLKNGDTNERS